MYTILHIDKSNFYRKTMLEMMTARGYKYIHAFDLEEGKKVLEQEELNLIITSLVGTGENVEEFIRGINNSEKRNIPIFVVTGSSLDDDKKRLLNLGVTDYILKEEFFNEINKHIEAIFQEDLLMNALLKCKIAIVDDSKFDLFRYKDILGKYNINNVDYYTSGKELMNSTGNYDIYLIDIVLKNEFGKNIIANIRRNNVKASIIAISSLDNYKLISSILDSGANDYITKPIDETLFIARLKSNARILVLEEKIKELNEKLNI